MLFPGGNNATLTALVRTTVAGVSSVSSILCGKGFIEDFDPQSALCRHQEEVILGAAQCQPCCVEKVLQVIFMLLITAQYVAYSGGKAY